MINYSISDLETITGIKAHTIRMWEKRYALITPKRTPSNIRYYTEDDLKKLLDVVLLYNNGNKISQIATMSTCERARKLTKLGENDQNIELRQDCLTAAVLDFDEQKFTTLLDNYGKKHGLMKAVSDYIFPFIENSALLYMCGTLNQAHENFVTQIVRKKLITAIEGMDVPACDKRGKVLIFLPSGEFQELYLAYMEYVCKFNCFQTLNIGLNLSFDDLAAVSQKVKPCCILTMIHTEFKTMSTQSYLNQLSTIFPDSKLVVTGCQVEGHCRSQLKQHHVLGHISELADFFKVPA
ncbi:MerR family transcriptional regulator [Membranihabitans marinus]|uniref:MerR family transcriptional regulator n=1 Tax=Membranihabitans marinus TaxID=1227546 RepID=UPI001F01EDB8|nr:MerR family transcriptional regulator [Membranihabitans marinus]